MHTTKTTANAISTLSNLVRGSSGGPGEGRIRGKGDDDDQDVQYEDQFDPKREPQDAMLSIMNSQALVLGADEDGANDISGNEEQEEAVVQIGMVQGVEDGQQDQTGRAGDSEQDRQCTQDLLDTAEVLGQPAGMSQPAFGGEAQVQEDCGHTAAGDEKRLEPLSADVRDVCDSLI